RSSRAALIPPKPAPTTTTLGRLAGRFSAMPTTLGRPQQGRIGETAGSAELEPSELHPRGDPELREHVPEMEVDRPRTQEELCGDLLVRRAAGDQVGDLELLRGQSAQRARVVALRCESAAAQLDPRALCPRGGAELVERLDRAAEMAASLASLPCPPERLAGQEPRAGGVERVARLDVQRDRPLERRDLAREQTAAARDQRGLFEQGE